LENEIQSYKTSAAQNDATQESYAKQLEAKIAEM